MEQKKNLGREGKISSIFIHKTGPWIILRDGDSNRHTGLAKKELLECLEYRDYLKIASYPALASFAHSRNKKSLLVIPTRRDSF